MGNGEQGKPYPMSDAERVDQAYRENGFNIFVSDKISLNRSLPDIRHPNCNNKLYLEKLPNTSVIIPFHNEGWSSLLRTVHSVLNRSPPELIAEIVLVDDFSDRVQETLLKASQALKSHMEQLAAEVSLLDLEASWSTGNACEELGVPPTGTPGTMQRTRQESNRQILVASGPDSKELTEVVRLPDILCHKMTHSHPDQNGLKQHRVENNQIAANVVVRRNLWLKHWKVDPLSKYNLSADKFLVRLLFGEGALHKVLVETKEKKKAMPSTSSAKDRDTKEHLKKRLEDYMARFPKVRILRTKKREGLIRTRMFGASVAVGGVITFLDSHCEANVNWLPPLLDRIARNRKTIVCPMIDVIDHDHFGYETQAGDAMRGAFDWEMYYKRIPIPPELQKPDPSDPFE
ncbi:UNVERIFIED_CONTAM: hypothetical protein K2H54_037949 [Gekko kuhli]